MTTQQLISPDVPTVNTTDTGNRALNIMDTSQYKQIPLVSDDNYIGLLQEKDLLDWDTPEMPLSQAEFINYKPAVYATTHPYEAIRLAHQMHLSVIPVLDSENKYIGAITENRLLTYIAENSGMEQPGGIIVLEVAPLNYSLYEIARICENEDVSVISTQMHTTPDNKLEITIKTNRINLDALVAAFERYSYKVTEVYGMLNNGDSMVDRYNLLMNYINM